LTRDVRALPGDRSSGVSHSTSAHVPTIGRGAVGAAEPPIELRLEAARMGAWDWDLVTNEVHWSPVHEALWGYAAGAFPGTAEAFLERIHPEDRAIVLAMGDRAMREREPFQVRYRVVRPGGELVWVESYGRHLYDGAGRATCAVGVTYDATERKLLEDVERTQRELARALAATGDLDEGLRLCLDAALAYADLDAGGVYLRDEVTGALELRFHSGLGEGFVAATSRYDGHTPNARLVATGAPIYARHLDLLELQPAPHRSEALRFVGIVPLPGEHGVVGALNVASHVVDDVPAVVRRGLEAIAASTANAIARLRSQARLREREELFSTMVAQAVDAMILVDASDAHFVEFNEAAHAGLGYTREEFARLSVHDIQADLSQEAVRGILDRLPTEGSFRVETKHRTKSGELRDASARGRSIELRGKHYAAVVWTDTTAQREAAREQDALREQLQQAQKMESIGRLADGVAHDFNNLLMVQLGQCEYLREGLRDDDPLAIGLGEIEAAAKRAAALTRQLLAFSRKQPLRPQVTDVNELVQGLGKMLGRLLGEDVALSLCASRTPALVKADAGQLEQVVVNLAVNARDAMPSGGALTIEIENVELEAAYAARHAEVAAGRYVLVAVSDTGTGMDAETQRRIFEPFFTTKEKGKGTGLGLATVYGIVKQTGGHVWVYSEVGHGTTFKVYLPCTEGAAEPRRARAPQRERGSGELVLVVEDDEAMREVVLRLLAGLGYRAVAATGGGDALLRIEEQGLRPHLVITDVVMPGMNGRMLVERLRRTQPDLRAVYMSGYTDNAILHHGVLDAGVLFLQKPFSSADLAAKVREALAGG
jgi:PAS domain S-box-containing protein